jgi:hypothetical protein
MSFARPAACSTGYGWRTAMVPLIQIREKPMDVNFVVTARFDD